MNLFDRILVPVDFSNCSHAACEHAADLAARLGASIDLLHVEEPPAWQGFVLPELVVNLPHDTNTSLQQYVETRTQRALEHLVDTLHRRGVKQVRHRRESGEAGTVILQVATDERFGLVVMGTHGRKGFERLMMGSVAERVVRSAPCPVLTVRVSDDAEVGTVAVALQEGAGA